MSLPLSINSSFCGKRINRETDKLKRYIDNIFSANVLLKEKMKLFVSLTISLGEIDLNKLYFTVLMCMEPFVSGELMAVCFWHVAMDIIIFRRIKRLF